MWAFFHEHSRITGLQGKGEGISLTPHYHFHSLHGHLDISRAIAAESSPLHIAGSRTRTGEPLISERKSLTTKLRALEILVRDRNNFIKKESLAQVFCEISKNTFFTEHLWVTASVSRVGIIFIPHYRFHPLTNI